MSQIIATVVWKRQGSVRWERDWVEAHGQSRSHIPGLEEHMSFANFDLNQAGYNKIYRDAKGALKIELPDYFISIGPRSAVQQILANHGFELMI